MIAFAIRLGVPPSVVLAMPEQHFIDCLALLRLEQRELNGR